jgi:hypothetical protein
MFTMSRDKLENANIANETQNAVNVRLGDRHFISVSGIPFIIMLASGKG